MPTLNDEDQARLLSCMEEIRNVVGESISERNIVETVLKNQYDCAKSLDELLNEASKPTPIIPKLMEPQTKNSKDTVEKGRFILFKHQI